ncbi:hypothetical protein [uncultured Bacteroides sp.]|uniref:hypothetical protein n=1 Tax=uncultured Bacteroides sp. TaxID=162156 RepID=UPI00267539E5|nr:hypothetical protein [uncultured Bacteroides sp.]
MRLFKYLSGIYEYMFYRVYIRRRKLWDRAPWLRTWSPGMTASLVPLMLFSIAFVFPLLFVFLYLLNIHNNNILVIIFLVTYFIAGDFTDKFFLNKGNYLEIVRKYENENRYERKRRTKQVWILVLITVLWLVVFTCIIYFVFPHSSNSLYKNSSPEYIEMLKDIRDRRAQ